MDALSSSTQASVNALQQAQQQTKDILNKLEELQQTLGQAEELAKANDQAANNAMDGASVLGWFGVPAGAAAVQLVEAAVQDAQQRAAAVNQAQSTVQSLLNQTQNMLENLGQAPTST